MTKTKFIWPIAVIIAVVAAGLWFAWSQISPRDDDQAGNSFSQKQTDQSRNQTPTQNNVDKIVSDIEKQSDSEQIISNGTDSAGASVLNDQFNLDFDYEQQF